jgi:hypothetical protein
MKINVNTIVAAVIAGVIAQLIVRKITEPK